MRVQALVHHPMQAKHGAGPTGATCESCVFLQPTATMERRPAQRGSAHTITTFLCHQLPTRQRTPWSVLASACGMYQPE